MSGVPPSEAAAAYYDLGNAYFELERFEDAISAYSRALELDDAILQAGYNLARVYIETGRMSKGIEILEKMLEADPENSVLLSTVAWAEYRSGNLIAALTGYERVLARIGNHRDSLYNAAMVARRLGKNTEAVDYLARYFDEYEDKTVLPYLGRWEIESGSLEKGISRLEQHAAEEKPEIEILILMGETYETLDRFGDSVKAYGEVLDKDSSRSEIRFEIARILLEEIEDYAAGMDELEKALDSGFEDTDAMRLLLENARSYYLTEAEVLFSGKGFDLSDGASR